MATGALKAIFSSAYADGIIERDPTVALVRPKAQRKDERRPLTQDETDRVLKVARTHPEGLILAVLYYLGLRRGEALGLKWKDFDFNDDQVHIERDIDFAGPTAQEGGLKTQSSERYVPVPAPLKALLLPVRGNPEDYVFHTKQGKPLSEASFKCLRCRLMLEAGLVEWREVREETNRPDDILKQVKLILTPHYFRHNYVTLLYESGVDPLVAMKIVGYSSYQTTADIYTHIRDDLPLMLFTLLSIDFVRSLAYNIVERCSCFSFAGEIHMEYSRNGRHPNYECRNWMKHLGLPEHFLLWPFVIIPVFSVGQAGIVPLIRSIFL